MTVARLVRHVLSTTAVLSLLSTLSQVRAADDKPKPPPKWETVRTTSPETADELKGLQTRVKELTQKATNATVGILVGQGAGSGVIVSDDGLVLTAAHVVGLPRTPLTFVLADGTFVKGVSLGVNEQADSGMARITEKPPAKWAGAKDGKWPFMEIGKSSDLKTGQWVVAMGHPGGPKPERPPPVRVGRFVTQASGRQPFLQANTTIVGGDSGGPLFDLDGKVVGIHSRIMFTIDANYQVPVDKFVAERVRLERGDAIGRRSDAVMNVIFDETVKDKLVVEEVTEGGAAERAGVEVGDVFLKFAGSPVKTPDDTRDMITAYNPNDKVKIELRRGDEIKTVEIKLAKRASLPKK